MLSPWHGIMMAFDTSWFEVNAITVASVAERSQTDACKTDMCSEAFRVLAILVLTA